MSGWFDDRVQAVGGVLFACSIVAAIVLPLVGAAQGWPAFAALLAFGGGLLLIFRD